MLVNDVKEKEPLPQSVEVLSHVAARAATFLVFAVTWTAFRQGDRHHHPSSNLMRSYRPQRTTVDDLFELYLFHSILCSHTDCVAVTVSGVDVTDVSILCSPYGLLWRPNGGKTMVLILCSHTQLTIYTGS